MLTPKPPSKSPKLLYFQSKNIHPENTAFEYPHFYTPTALAQDAAKDLQKRLRESLPHLVNQEKGRMLGVLVVREQNGKVGYLAAYSGEFQAQLEVVPFVPSVYQLPKGEDFPEMARINAISKDIKALKNNKEYQELKTQLEKVKKETQENIHRAKRAAKAAKAERDQRRNATMQLPEREAQELLNQLSKEGANAGMDLRRFTRSEKQKLEQAQEALDHYEAQIKALKAIRKAKSAELQTAIFKAFTFLNSSGESKDVKMVFNDFGIDIPPAGAGECAAPKLFQYAFQKGFKPLALAEFWWGKSPNSAIREHGKFYPACRGKCEPILAHMLKGMPVKPNPMLKNQGAEKELELLYEDEFIAIINKPSGVLSVPGRHIDDSVQTRIQQAYPHATGPLIVHRLDQDTSGIMILALSKEAHKKLQQQFLNRSVRKTYVAILEKPIHEESGEINLPLILDYHHRPMQMVDFESGKTALTKYQLLDKTATRSLIQLKPITGRSHQLRVHCAHHLGLHAPIVGDNLYGKATDRLYLHAQEIHFTHPISKKAMHLKTESPFSI